MQIQIIQTVLPIHMRMAELFTVNQMRELSLEEMEAMEDCLLIIVNIMTKMYKVNANYYWEAAYIENMRFMDSMINDVAYVDEISLEDKNENS